MINQKPMRWQSPRYLKWIRSQPCAMCGVTADAAHHIKGVGHMSGAGTKAPDWATLPLCTPCHQRMHETPSIWVEQWEMITRTLGRAIESGIFK